MTRDQLARQYINGCANCLGDAIEALDRGDWEAALSAFIAAREQANEGAHAAYHARGETVAGGTVVSMMAPSELRQALERRRPILTLVHDADARGEADP